MDIKVNGKEFTINSPQISYNELLFLSGFNPEIKRAVTYKVVREGVTFVDGDTVMLHDQMFFTVAVKLIH